MTDESTSQIAKTWCDDGLQREGATHDNVAIY